MSSKPCKFYIGDSDTALDYNQMREYLFKNPDFFEQGINPQISKTQIDEKATETGERTEVRKPDQETAKAGQERGVSQGDSGQRGAQEVRQGEVPEVSGKGEEVTDQQIDQAAQKAGVKPKNLRDLYNINRELFGLDRIKSFASAIAMDRMVGAMAKRAGVAKEQMYGRLKFEKASENFVKGLSAKGKVLFQLVGENAQLAQDIRDNLQVARDMETAGKDAKTIRLATGWEKGADGKWRYEIIDGEITEKLENYIDNPLTAIEGVKLSEAIVGADLLKLYPQLSDITVKLYMRNDGTKGVFEKESNKIFLNLFTGGANKSTLLHEIQHAIQDIEGFAKGGSVENYVDYEDFLLKSQAEQRQQLQNDIDKLNNEIKSNRESLKDSSFSKDIKEYIQKDIDNAKSKIESLTFIRDSIKEGYFSNKEKYEAYLKLAGEVEARNVQTRMGMTPEQRRQTLLSETEDVARDEQIVLFDSKGIQMQVDAWHGSPYQFDKFTTEKIGTGEGAQAFGWGLYFTDLESIAKQYASKLGAAKANIFEILKKANSEQAEWIKNAIERRTFNGVPDYGGVLMFDLPKKYPNLIPRTLYKVSIHKGKSPDQYTWLEWDKYVSDDIEQKVRKQIEKENVRPFKLSDEDFGVNGIGELSPKKIYYDVDELFLDSTGKELYSDLSDVLGGDKQASLFLLRAGIDGIKYPAESISRGATSDTARGFNYVVFDENAVSIEEVIKFQKDAEKARGAMMISMDGQAVIYALTDPNVSTPLHEMAHVFEHYLTDAERAAVQNWAGTKAWDTQTSEKFARGFEKYLAEGKAPTPALQKIFEKFKQWLTDIYNGITGSEIDIELNEQMRDIYAKMLGAEATAPTTPTTPPAAPKSELEALAEEFGKEVESAMKAKPFEKKAEAQEKAAEKTKKAQKKAQEETKETELAKEDSGDMLGDLFSEFNQKPDPPKQTLGIVPPAVARMMQPPPPAPTSIFPPAVQKRMDEARKKPQTESAYKKLLNRLNRLSNGFARQYQELAPVKYAEVIEILRKLKAAPGLAKTLAERHMQNIWGDLNPTQRAHFQDYIIASDMLGSIEDGLYGTDVLWAGEKGPHGYNSFQEVRDAVAKGQAIVNADPKLKDAIDRRNAFVDRLWETSKKAGLASGEQIGSGQSYFHRKHLKYEEEGVALDAIMQSSARRKKPAQFKKRKGATSDYLTNFAEVEFGVVASTGFEIAKRQYINEIVKEYEPIYKSMKAEAKQEAQDAIDDIERTYGAGSPEHTIALENQKDLEDKILAQLMGDDYKLYFPDGKNSLFRTDVAMGTDVEDAITQAANGQTGLAIQNLTDALRPVVMLAKGRQIFIPTDIANLFDRLGEVKGDSEPIIEDFLEGVAGVTKVVKKIYLLSPFRFPKYLVGNLAGDADKIAAADSGIPKKLPQAVKILWDAKKGKYDPWYTKAVKYGVFSGTLSDIGDVSEAAWSKFATDKNPDVGDFVRKAMENMGGVKWSIEKYFELVGRLANAREDAFRLAAFIRASEQIEKGKNIYWFSNKNVIDNLKDNEVKAAKLAREIFGDYIAISQSGEVLSKYLYPFYRFRETNIRGYKNFIFNNLNTKAGREKIIKYGVSRGLTVAATRLLIHSMQLALFTAIVAAYNSIFWPEEEEELRKGGDQSFHIITGRNSDGSIRVLRTQGTLNAFMESMGINGIRQFYQDYGNKDVTMADVAKEPAKAFTNEFYQGVTPLIKVPFELASGKSRFPNVFRPRAIRDNTEYLFTSAALRQPYEMLTDAPRAKKDILSLFLTSDMNPKEIAYYQTLNKVSDDIGRVTMVSTPGTSVMSKRKTEKQDALYRWKMNVKFNNIEKADQALVEYYKLGGQAKDIKQSLRAINPLNNYSDFVQKSIETLADGKSIDFSNAKPVGRSDSKMFVKIGNTQYTANYDEIEYVRGLSKKDITMFKMALEYYKDIKDKSEAYLKKSDKKK